MLFGLGCFIIPCEFQVGPPFCFTLLIISTIPWMKYNHESRTAHEDANFMESFSMFVMEACNPCNRLPLCLEMLCPWSSGKWLSARVSS